MPYTKPNLNLPDSVENENYIKTYLLMQPYLSTSLFADLNCFVELWLTLHRIRTRARLQVRLRTPQATEQTYRLWKPLIRGWICVMLTFKSICFQNSQHINIVLKLHLILFK